MSILGAPGEAILHGTSTCVAYNTCDKTKAHAVALGKFKLKGILCREVVLFSDAYKGKMGECHFYR